MNHDIPAHGLRSLVHNSAAVFIVFAFSFFKPETRRDWRTLGGFSPFIVALFVEMYGSSRSPSLSSRDGSVAGFPVSTRWDMTPDPRGTSCWDSRAIRWPVVGVVVLTALRRRMRAHEVIATHLDRMARSLESRESVE